MFKKFSVLILGDLVSKAVLYGLLTATSASLARVNPSFLIFSVSLFLLFIVPSYFVIVLIYNQVVRELIGTQRIKSSKSGYLFSMLFTMVISVVVYVGFFIKEWPLNQSVAFFINSLIIGVILWKVFGVPAFEKQKESMPQDS